MRIRKNARIQALSTTIMPPPLSPPIREPTTPCQLNQSPWDFLPFSSHQSDDFCFPDEYQVKLPESVTRNTVCGESSNVNESIGSSKKREVKKEVVEYDGNDKVYALFDERVDEGKKKKRKMADKDYSICSKNDGKGWNCKFEAKEGHSLCEYHLSKLKPYNPSAPKTNAAKAAARRRNTKSKLSSASPRDFYYYSGFDPSWSKRRGGRRECSKIEVKQEVSDGGVAQTTSSVRTDVPEIVCDGLGYVYDIFDDDDSDDDGGGGGEKKNRKPVKARSLKSLL